MKMKKVMPIQMTSPGQREISLQLSKLPSSLKSWSQVSHDTSSIMVLPVWFLPPILNLLHYINAFYAMTFVCHSLLYVLQLCYDKHTWKNIASPFAVGFTNFSLSLCLFLLHGLALHPLSMSSHLQSILQTPGCLDDTRPRQGKTCTVKNTQKYCLADLQITD